MAVRPDYRGRGLLIKQVSQPVYAALAALGGVAGVGFSNAAGVRWIGTARGMAIGWWGKCSATSGDAATCHMRCRCR
ncbi:MAG: hypothetical protein R3E31_06070 [Chloroflexota bacterium]